MRFYTADLHLGHKNIIKYCNRPFANVGEMNNILIANINEVADVDDELWILGDLAMGKLDESLSWVSQIRPKVQLVAGNHDRCWIGERTTKPIEQWEDQCRRYLDAGIEGLWEYASHTISERTVYLSHFPYQGDHTDEDRFAEWRLPDRGRWLLCGHIHNLWKQQVRQINVGIDVRDYYPVSEQEVSELITRGPLNE
jgi:calcineurin-like phosphoesterase family protein